MDRAICLRALADRRRTAHYFENLTHLPGCPVDPGSACCTPSARAFRLSLGKNLYACYCGGDRCYNVAMLILEEEEFPFATTKFAVTDHVRLRSSIWGGYYCHECLRDDRGDNDAKIYAIDRGDNDDAMTLVDTKCYALATRARARRRRAFAYELFLIRRGTMGAFASCAARVASSRRPMLRVASFL
jgi:hypothetical protein